MKPKGARKAKKCLKPDCGRDVYVRGLCANCYYAARKLVADGKVTWHELEQARRCRPMLMRVQGATANWFLTDLPAKAGERCHCGLLLHYEDKATERMMNNTVYRYGKSVPVAYNGILYEVPRHYIALHGINPAELPNLGFKRSGQDSQAI